MPFKAMVAVAQAEYCMHSLPQSSRLKDAAHSAQEALQIAKAKPVPYRLSINTPSYAAVSSMTVFAVFPQDYPEREQTKIHNTPTSERNKLKMHLETGIRHPEHT